MTETTKPQQKPEPKEVAKPTSQKIKTIQAVYGRMVDPHTGEEFTCIPKVAGQLTSWVQSQVDAGKLALN